MNWIWAALMPHPPFIVPQVGRGRERRAPGTLAGARTLMAKIAPTGPGGGRPDFLLLLSPHHHHVPGALLLNAAPILEGSLKRFGAPKVRFKLTNAQAVRAALAVYLAEAGFPLAEVEAPDLTLDHAALVPLAVLSRLWPDPPPVILANPRGLSPALALALGRSLAAFQPPAGSGALLASGDLSHRLNREAPAGFHPEGAVFDREVLAALARAAGAELTERWPPERLAQAGECGFCSALTLMGLAGEAVEIISYEAPFGVGYCYALWRPAAAAEAQ